MTTMMTIWNKTAKTVCDHINGTEVRVPALGSVDVSDKKALAMLKMYPNELTRMAPGSYNAEQEAIVRAMPAAAVLEFALKLMRGELPEVKAEKPTEGTEGHGTDGKRPGKATREVGPKLGGL